MACLLLLVYFLPLMGFGPIWKNFATLVEPCQTKWWTNMIWVNNFYPANFDDKCLPWTWFLPCYVQLTMSIPILIGLHRMMGGKLKGATAIMTIWLALIGINYGFVFNINVGGSIVMNEEFFAKVFMNPLYHSSSFVFGVACALMYRSMFEDRNESLSNRVMELILNNSTIRYFGYLFGIALYVLACIW